MRESGAGVNVVLACCVECGTVSRTFRLCSGSALTIIDRRSCREGLDGVSFCGVEGADEGVDGRNLAV